MSDPWDEAYARARAAGPQLDDRLAVIRDACRVLSPAYDAAIDAFVARLTAAEVGRDAPAPGAPFPDFALPDERGRIWRFAAMREDRPMIVALHRGGWCDFCQITLEALAEAQERVAAAGGGVVAVAPQRAVFAKAHLAGAGARFPMLCDMDGGLALALGLSCAVDEAMRGQLLEFGIDIGGINGDSGLTLPIPATFVVDRGGVVRLRHVDVDPRRRVDIGALVQAVASAA